MYWLDATILVLLAVGAGLGFWSGMFIQVARVLGLVASVYASVFFNDPVTRLVKDRFLTEIDERLIRIVAYGLVFLFVFLVLFIITRLIVKLIRESPLATLDRIMGSVLGTVKIALVLAGVCGGLNAVSMPTTKEWMEKSALAPYFAKGLDVMMKAIPDESKTQVNDHVQQWRDALQRRAVDEVLRAAKEE